MRKLSEVLKKPVQSQAEGTTVGTIKDAVLDATGENILAFVTKEKSLLGPAKIVPFSSVQEVGPDAVMVENAQAVVSAESDPAIKQAADDKTKLSGKQLLTEDGVQLGTVADALFDETTGKIVDVGINPSKERKQQGPEPTAIPMSEVKGIGEGAMVTEANPSFIAQEAAMEASPPPSLQVPPPPSVPKPDSGIFAALKQKAASLKGGAAAKSNEKRELSVLGKPATRTVLDNEDRVIVEQDGLITHAVLEESKQRGVEELAFKAGEGK